jgi:hypothetical protein
MAITRPTHVVTISVWDTHRAESVVHQVWVSAGPFDGPAELAYHLHDALVEACDAVELVDTRTSRHARHVALWEQLSLI